MKRNKIVIAALLTALAFTGCAQNTAKKDVVVGSSIEQKEDKTSDINKYDTIGEIIEFRDDSVTVLTGDIAEDFKVDKDKLVDFYLGETVSVKRNDNGSYDINRFIAKDMNYDIRHTSMGELIESKQGTVKEISDSNLVLSTEEGDIEFKLYSPIELESGATITVDYLNRGGEMSVIQYFNEDYKLQLTVKKIERAENTGIMLIEAQDEKDMKYIVDVDSGAVLNFAHSTLKVGDKITVYPESIRESYPAQVTPSKILKKN